MVERYERKNWTDDIGQYIDELRSLEELLAIFHKTPVTLAPIDSEVGLSEEDLKHRIRKREAEGLEVDEEEKAKQDFERYRQHPHRKGPG
ncbi:MAG: hypothetical protein K0S35_1319 [Geminicoccaceae bacterium]|nr:hypothetical protein [Geminicoccaceae bacterium]